jgi:hypothetical protein
MTTRKRLGRTLALVLTGGLLLQVGGCSAFIVPLLFSVAEQVLLSFLLGALGGGG